MQLFKRVQDLRDWLAAMKNIQKIIGFVPTMGALHEGHLSLAVRSTAECDITVVSIFVNPKQFNDPSDLAKYPRPIEKDLRMLEETGVNAVFLPDVIDMYPEGDHNEVDFDPGHAATVMEGKFRPGHFKGMAEVVYRLLKIVEPDKLFMGQKDFQQLAIVRKLIADMQMPVILEMCPTVREANGLAMSSRNERLSPGARERAGIIYSTLVNAQRQFGENEPVEKIKKEAWDALTQEDFVPEYFEIVDGVTFKNVSSMEDSQYVVALCAIQVEGVRLIDNLIWIRNE